MNSLTTKGHSAAQGGLRGHSMGDSYPETVIGLGDGFAKYNLLTGETGPVRPTYDAALFWEELDQACPTACPRASRPAVCSPCEWFTAENYTVVRAFSRAYGIGEVRLALLKGVAA